MAETDAAVSGSGSSVVTEDALEIADEDGFDETEIQPLLPADDARARTVLVSVLELTPTARDGEVARIGAELTAVDEHPVFMTDHADFSIFVDAGYFYEYLPPIADQVQHASGPGWEVYLARKVRLILAKWQPERVIACGCPIEDFIRRTAEAHLWPGELPP